MVVDGDGEDLLGAILTDDVLIQTLVKFFGRQHLADSRIVLLNRLVFFFDNFPAKLDALIADVDRTRAGYQAANFLLAFATKGTPIMNSATARAAAHTPPFSSRPRRSGSLLVRFAIRVVFAILLCSPHSLQLFDFR